jgi:lipid-binding SYLF domain-containing protein
MLSIKKERYFPLFFVVALVFFTVPFTTQTAYAEPEKDEVEKIEKALEVLEEIIMLPEEGLPDFILRKAHGIAIIPGVIKAAYGIGGQFGKGVFLIRDKDEDWSNPCFITITGGSLGWQIGVQKIDIILVFMSQEGVGDITEGTVTLGADASITAGPMGRRAEASTDLELEAEIYSYSKSRGLFAGVSIQGAQIKVDDDANRDFYDKRHIDTDDIFYRKRMSVPSIAKKLKRRLTEYTQKLKFL